jgi:uncharacterized protein YggU (UPF0235/DUF167 family)
VLEAIPYRHMTNQRLLDLLKERATLDNKLAKGMAGKKKSLLVQRLVEEDIRLAQVQLEAMAGQ